jgi:hypothetical protein
MAAIYFQTDSAISDRPLLSTHAMAGMGSNQDEHKLLRDARGEKKDRSNKLEEYKLGRTNARLACQE